MPVLTNRTALKGTGQLPKLEDDMYYCGTDDLFLIPDGRGVGDQHPHGRDPRRGRSAAELLRILGLLPPRGRRRRRDTRGMFRVHQFNKVEMVKFVRPETSWDELEKLTADAEELLQKLDLPYRVAGLATGDLSFAAAKCYDLEVWSAGVEKWLEVSSCSNFGDFQARRGGIRFKGEGAKGFVHTLNGSGLALPRMMVAILENYQTGDGRIRIPEVLVPYLGGQEYIG